MKIISEKTGKSYSTVDECLAAEKDYEIELQKKVEAEKAKAETRAARAKEVTDALKTLTDARKAYQEKVAAFCKDFGSFHCTLTSKDIPNTFSEVFENLFKEPFMFPWF